MTAATGPAAIRALRALPQPPDPQRVLAIVQDFRGELATSMGVEITEFSVERVVATMPVVGNRQPFGLLHGGASAALAETMGSIHGSLVGGGKAPLGIELSCAHHRSASGGLVTAVSTPLHVGRTICTFEIVITDDADQRICTARLTVLLRDLPHSTDGGPRG
ncbi:MAG TPA: hotdog fold thioesterase [Nakamurella sp.]